MKKKTPAEMQNSRNVKIARTMIRLKHSLAADEELNEVLPDLAGDFDLALLEGRVKRIQGQLSDIIGNV